MSIDRASASRVQFQNWVALLLSFSVIGVIVIIALFDFPGLLFTQVFSGSSKWDGAPRDRTGTIVLQTDPDHCQQFEFDNDRGLIRRDARPCKAQGGESAPAPIGTIHRLDAISKSFLER